jgi:hypothetical protein
MDDTRDRLTHDPAPGDGRRQTGILLVDGVEDLAVGPGPLSSTLRSKENP